MRRRSTVSAVLASLLLAGVAACGSSHQAKHPAAIDSGQDKDPYAASLKANRPHVNKLCEVVKDAKKVTPKLDVTMWKLYTTIPQPDDYAKYGIFQYVKFIHDGLIEETSTVDFGVNESLADIQTFCNDPYHEI